MAGKSHMSILAAKPDYTYNITMSRNRYEVPGNTWYRNAR